MADREYRSHYPELTERDVKEFDRLANICEERVRTGAILSVEACLQLPFADTERLKSYQTGATHLADDPQGEGTLRITNVVYVTAASREVELCVYGKTQAAAAKKASR